MKPRVLYIMGEGRSGSTVLDLVLGNAAGVCGVGELWSFLADDPQLTGDCSCGAAFRDCPFWNDVRERFFARLGHRDLIAVRRIQRRQDRLRTLPAKLAGRWGRDFETYININRWLYQSIHEVSGAAWVLDSTKQVGRALNLTACQLGDLHLIHLVRDGRAVIWSRRRDRLRQPTLRRKGPLTTSIAWTVKNAMALEVSRRAPHRTILIRYTDFACHPEQELERLGRHLGLDTTPLVTRLRRGETFTPGHQIGGNARARLGARAVRVRPDREWETHLSAGDRRMFWATSGWLAQRLGYSRDPDRS